MAWDAKAVRAFVRRLSLLATEDPRIRALWVEGPTPLAARDYPALAAEGALDLRMATEDPSFDAVIGDAEAMLAKAAAVASAAWSDAPFEGRRLDATLEGGLAVAITVERLSLVGKRPRDAIEPIVDKTGMLREVVNIARG